jgi:hypothetical protein
MNIELLKRASATAAVLQSRLGAIKVTGGGEALKSHSRYLLPAVE